jgi:hypothetical protein
MFWAQPMAARARTEMMNFILTVMNRVVAPGDPGF